MCYHGWVFVSPWTLVLWFLGHGQALEKEKEVLDLFFHLKYTNL
jgi:hypothetical protein